MSTNQETKVVHPDIIAKIRRILSPCNDEWAKEVKTSDFSFTELWGAYDAAPQKIRDKLRPIFEKEFIWWDTIPTTFTGNAIYLKRIDKVLSDPDEMDAYYLRCLDEWNVFNHPSHPRKVATEDPFSNPADEELTKEQYEYLETYFSNMEDTFAAEVTTEDIGAGMKITDSSEHLGKSIIKFVRGLAMAGSAAIADHIADIIDKNAAKVFSDDFIPDPELIGKALQGTALKPYAWLVEGVMSIIKKSADKMEDGTDDIADIISNSIDELLDKAEGPNFDDLVEIINRVKSKVNIKAPSNDDDDDNIVAVIEAEDEEEKTITPVPKKKTKKEKEKVVKVTAQDVAAAMKRIPDEDLAATARTILATPHKVAPGFITQAPLNVQPEVKEEEPSFLTINDIPDHLKDVVNKNPWILKIMNIGISNTVYLQLDPILNSVGDIVAMKFIANNSNGTFIPTKSFCVDFGMVINRALAVWPNIVAGQNGEVLTMPFETCDVAYKLDVNTKNGYEINRPFFNKLFMVGFSGLSSDDRSRNSRYSKQLINANRRLVMITRPNKSNDKEFNAYFNNASFKCAQELDKLAESGSIPKDARFKISLYDPENGSVELTTEGVPQYWLTEANQPLLKFHGFPVVKEGQFVKDEAGREYFYLIKVEG